MSGKLGSRLGFLMLAAGCAVGLGNVWRFPYVVGANGGAAFVLIYLVCLLVLGLPLMTVELAIGRGSGHGVSKALRTLCDGRNVRVWGVLGVVLFLGNALLMSYYTDVTGWLLKYASSYAGGADMPVFGAMTGDRTGDRTGCLALMLVTVAAAAFVCACGLQGGLERVTKFLMLSLLALMGVLAVRALTLDGAAKGVAFYLKPDWTKFAANPRQVTVAAMGQAFFTLSVGIGAVAIFGAYVDRRHSLFKESLWIIAIDTFVALTAGLIIFPACMTYGIEPDSGPGLIFVTLPKVFAAMAGGRFWGALFFVFLFIAAFTTVMAVFECIIGGLIDEFGWGRRKTAALVGLSVALISLPCVLVDGALEVEDFAVSNVWLPGGAMALCLFATRRFGWGLGGFEAELRTGEGVKMPGWMIFLLRWIVPLLVAAVMLSGLLPGR